MVTMTLYERQQKRHRCKEQTLDSGRRQGWDDSIQTCILPYVKWIASPGSMHETSAQGWCTGMTLRAGMGREVGGIQDGEHMYTHG